MWKAETQKIELPFLGVSVQNAICVALSTEHRDNQKREFFIPTGVDMEDQGDYITEALEMIGIDLDKPKKIVQEISGFTPLFDAVVTMYKDETRAAVHGAMWRFCQMEDGVCKASLETIAKMIGVSPATVMRHAEALVSDGFFVDLTPDLRNAPHIYADTGKVAMKSSVTAGISQRKATVSESQLIKDSNKDIEESPAIAEPHQKKGDILDGILDLTFKPKAVREAFAKFFRLTPNWEAKYNRQFLEWAVEIGMTPEQVQRAADVWRSDKRFNWSVPTLKGVQEHWFELIETQKEEVKEYTRLL